MRSIRLLAVATAAAALVSACAKTDPGTAAPAAGPAATTSAAPVDNGVAALTATQILAKAKTAFQNSGSVHIKGSGFSDGQQIGLDMRIKGSAGGAGTLTINGQVISITRIGRTVYVKADEAFWRSQTGSADAARLLGGKYLKAPSTNTNFAELASFTDLPGAAKDLLEPDGAISKGKRKTVAGVPAIGLVDTGKDGGTMYIALQGQPYPLQLVSTGSTDDQGSIDFLEYGKPVPLAAPPAALTIDVSKLPH